MSFVVSHFMSLLPETLLRCDSGRTFICKSRRPQCTCWGEYTSDDGLAGRVGEMDVEISTGVNDMPQDLSCAGQHLIVVCTRYADGLGEGTMRHQCTMRKTCVHFANR